MLQAVNLEVSIIVIVQSLPIHERQTGTELYDDIIIRLCYRRNLQCGLIDIENKEQFLALGNFLFQQFRTEKLRPIIHFEIHGDEDGLELANGERVSWAEVGRVTRPINAFLKNQLFITFATCKGIYNAKGVANPTILAPFWGFVAPKTDINTGEIIEDFTVFYECLLTEWNLDKAVMLLNAGNPNSPYALVTAELIFNSAIKEYFEIHPLDKQAMFKRMSPQMKEKHPLLSQEQRDRWLKQLIDEHDREEFINDCRKAFLCL